jgi:osmotically-inducible protein OsmY
MTDRDRWSDQRRNRDDEDDYRSRRSLNTSQSGYGSSRYASDYDDDYDSRQRDYSGEFGSSNRSDRYGYGSGSGSDRYGQSQARSRGWESNRDRDYDAGGEFQTSRQRYTGTGYYGSAASGSPGSSGDYFGAGDYGSGAHAWDRNSTQSRAGSGRYASTYSSSGLTSAPGTYDREMPRQSFQRSYDQGQDRGFLERASDEVMSWFGDEDAARRREMDHRGLGPSDYTRSDERIREDANDRLTDDWRVDARQISVAVQDGEVTLNGKVPSRDAKRRAEDCVECISGVKHVQNNLRVDDALTGNGGTSASWNQHGATGMAGTMASGGATGLSGSTPSGSTSNTTTNSTSTSTTGAAAKGRTTGSTSA